MKILVTGSAGFIGSHLVQRLVTDGHEVVGFDNFSNGIQANIDRIQGEHRFIEGDLRDPGAVAKAMDGAEVVFHQGALGSVPRSIDDPSTSMDVNTMGTLNVLNAARDGGVRRVVFASSSAVYGDSDVSPTHEGLKPRPLTPYAISKLSAEQMCGVFTHIYGLETVALRYFNVFGPFQDSDSQYAAVIPKFLTALAQGKRPTIFGDGEQIRGFTHVDDVVSGNVAAMSSEAANGRALNLASDTATSVREVLRSIEDAMEIKADPVYAPAQPGDIRESQADITLARELLSWEPVVSFEEGIRHTVDAFLEYNENAVQPDV